MPSAVSGWAGRWRGDVELDAANPAEAVAVLVLGEVALWAHLDALGPGGHDAVGHPLDEVVESDAEQLEVGQAVHPGPEGDAGLVLGTFFHSDTSS